MTLLDKIAPVAVSHWYDSVLNVALLLITVTCFLLIVVGIFRYFTKSLEIKNKIIDNKNKEISDLKHRDILKYDKHVHDWYLDKQTK